MIALASAPLARVTRRDPCPICDKPDYCGFTEDGALAICMRVAEGAIKTTKNGGYLHRLREGDWQPARIIQRKPDPPPAAPIERRHAVYEAFLDALPLSNAHADSLTERGLSDLTIARNGYATLPDTMQTIYQACETLAIFQNLSNVPGFFLDYENRWRFTARRPGFLIPVRDVEGHIQALQIRQDTGTRYIWFSSPNRNAGASSGAPVHFARPWRALASGEAIVTEGALKADVIAERLDCCVVGIPGVSSFALNFGTWLADKLPVLKTVYVAYDADWRDKSEVRAALHRLLDALAEAGLNGAVLAWNGARAKGLDDLLTGGQQ